MDRPEDPKRGASVALTREGDAGRSARVPGDQLGREQDVGSSGLEAVADGSDGEVAAVERRGSDLSRAGHVLLTSFAMSKGEGVGDGIRRPAGGAINLRD
jgi:hypothetical protein